MRRGFIARQVLVASVCVLPVAALIAVLTTGVMSKGMLEGPGWVALAQCLHPWTDAGTYLHPCTTTDNVVVGASSEASADIRFNDGGSAIFNEQGNSSDFRVEGDNNPDLIHTIASSDRVAIGSDSASALLDVTQSGGSPVTTNCVLSVQKNANASDSCDVNIIGGAEGTTRVCFGDTDNPVIAEWYTDSASGLSSLKSDTIYIEGGQKVKRTAVTANYTVLSSDYYVGVSGASNVDITLPSASTAGAGKTYVIKREDTNTSTIKIITSVEGTANRTNTSAYSAITLVSNGSIWLITNLIGTWA